MKKNDLSKGDQAKHLLQDFIYLCPKYSIQGGTNFHFQWVPLYTPYVRIWEIYNYANFVSKWADLVEKGQNKTLITTYYNSRPPNLGLAPFTPPCTCISRMKACREKCLKQKMFLSPQIMRQQVHITTFVPQTWCWHHLHPLYLYLQNEGL